MKLWIEGFEVTGQKSGAQYLGDFPGDTLEEAFKNWSETVSDKSLLNPERMTYWGCKVFNSEKDAKRSFG